MTESKNTYSREKIQLVNELHAPARRRFTRRQVIQYGIGDTFEADLIEMQEYSRENTGYRYVLCVIDIFSKFAWAVPLKTKSGVDVTKAFTEVLKDGKLIPRNLHTDSGKEFFNSHFQSLMQKHKINHYVTYSTIKASIVERFNRTLKQMLYKQFSLQGNYKWVKLLPIILNKYNHKKHRTIGMQPAKVNKKNEKKLLSSVYNRLKIAGHGKFKVNQYVRISKQKKIFEKGYLPNWSTEIFQVKKIKITNPVTYLLQDFEGNDIAGGFYEHELLPVKNPNVYLVEKVLRKQGNQVYVKWLGFDSSHNSWIEKNAIV